MIAFHGKQEIKKKYLARVKAHEKADEIIKGVYWENGKGCAVGCTVHSKQHSAYETELGIPQLLARLEDGIFEALPNELAKTWPYRFLSAIKPGVDLSRVWPQFAIWLLTDEQHGVIKFAKNDEHKEAIQTVADLHMYHLAGFTVSTDDWSLARSAAAAAYAPADASAYAYADADAPYAYAYDAAYAAYAARAIARRAQSDKLLELLKSADKEK